MHNCDIAVYGLGVMGKSLAQNMANHGFSVCGYSKSEKERDDLASVTKEIVISVSEAEMIASLARPRKIFLMITAGEPVDQVLESILPQLEAGDVVMDGGNSYYKDTNRRQELCDTYGIHYLGVGVSGGEKGALYGPSMMAGGSEEGYQICQNILETCAASVDKVPCCAYVGPQGAGHYVKMVHNGMEYAMLQIVAEIYTFMKQSLRLSHEKILETFEGWKRSGISSYIIDISVSVLRKNENGKPLVEQILDVAGQKGTGRWTLEEGIQRGIYIPTIYEAVAARNFSLRKEERKKGNQILGTLQEKMEIEFYQKVMGDALELGMLICYAQGFSLIEQASTDFEWNMELANLAVIWRKGCIIRSEMLSSIQKALQEESMIIFSSQFKQIEELSKALRLCVGKANQAGMAMPGLASVMHYYDYYRMETLPIQFIQALRDCFGAHTYQRIDKEGDFHTNWEE